MTENKEFKPVFTKECEEWLTPSEKTQCLVKFNNEVSRYAEEELKKVGTRPEDIWNDIQNLALYNPDTNIKRVKEAVADGSIMVTAVDKNNN